MPMTTIEFARKVEQARRDSARDIVFDAYPDARAEEVDGYWFIILSDDIGGLRFAAKTEHAAWYAASRFIGYREDDA